MLKRLDEAFRSFFRRVKAGQAPGFPRFRPLSRCVTIDLAQISGGTVKPRGSHYELQVKGFPRIRLHGSRELPDAVAKSVRLTKRGRHWEASLVYAAERAALPASAKAVGIDLGVRKCMTLSNGKRYRRATRDWKRKRRMQRAVARCRKGSRRRRKRVQAQRAGSAGGVRAGEERLPPGHDRDHPRPRTGRGGAAAGAEDDALSARKGGTTGEKRRGEGRAQPGDTVAELGASTQPTRAEGLFRVRNKPCNSEYRIIPSCDQ